MSVLELEKIQPEAVTAPRTTAVPPSGVQDTLRPAQLRQGDVLLYSVNALPADVTQLARPEGGFTLMPSRLPNGSRSHTLAGENVTAYSVSGSSEVGYIRVGTGFTMLTHHEHEALIVPAGIFQVRRQREHVPTSADVVPQVRAVVD